MNPDVRMLCGSLAVAASIAAQSRPAHHQERVAWVPNPRTLNGTWVGDESGRLGQPTVDSLNALISALEAETAAEIAVVVVDSLAGLTEQEFALAIHRAWGVGKRDADNGVVLLWAPNDRAVFISVGYGLEGAIPDRLAGRIRDQQILPAFRRSDFDQGVLAAVSALAAAVREEHESGSGAPRASPRTDDGGPGALGWLAGVLGLGAGGVGGTLGVRRWRRRRPRDCPSCGARMRLLGEAEDDAKLDQASLLEEQLGSVDWDVWVCGSCGTTSPIPYRRLFSSYSGCPKCERRTLSTTTRTLVRATTSRGGREQVTVRCRNCGHTKITERATPRVSKSSGGGHAGGGGGGGGGSSFGGGSAGGGGAGGRY